MKRQRGYALGLCIVAGLLIAGGSPGAHGSAVLPPGAVLTAAAALSQGQLSCADVNFQTDFAFTIEPDSGNAPLEVTFTPTLLPPGTVSVLWYPEGPPVEGAADPPTVNQILAQNPSVTYTYEAPGTYNIAVAIQLVSGGPFCPGTTINNPPAIVGGITVDEEADQPPTADLSFTDLTRDGHALLPLMDWVPLFQFTMGFSEDEFAPRIMRELLYSIIGAPTDPGVPYADARGPDVSDLLEFGLFLEGFSDSDDDGVLDNVNDRLLFTWDNTGFPYGELTAGTRTPLSYRMTFADGAGNPLTPEPVIAGPNTDTSIEGRSYIVAVRTSATWRTHLTMRPRVDFAVMVDDEGNIPRDDEGAPIDSYSPSFFEGENLLEEASYSSSFTVWDGTGTTGGAFQPGFFDAWNRPHFLYSPPAAHFRPRWNKLDELVDFVPGEFLQIRRLVPYGAWTPVLALNIHSTKAVHFDDFQFASIRDPNPKDGAMLREVNVILTDVGADPAGPPGNGGFDPRTGLSRFAPGDAVHGAPVVDGFAVAEDISFNGIWVWHDTNGNGVFDPPVQLASGGINFGGDLPLFGENFFRSPVVPHEWEYIPFPPGGGDPWWKIRLRFFEGARRAGFPSREDLTGYLDPVPNSFGVPESSAYYPDFFVVIRTDSGFQEVSLAPPTGTGVQAGAEFRAFIEPRRFNPVSGNFDGGIHVSSQIPPTGLLEGPNEVFGAWQNDPLWGFDEPWWPQRTMNQKSAKPLRTNVEVHDLVLTYSSDSPHRFTGDIFLGGGSRNQIGCLGFSNPVFEEPVTGPISLTGFDRWMDPFGLEAEKFRNLHSVGVTAWRLFGAASLPIVDLFGNSYGSVNFSFDDTVKGLGQYAFETVPFRFEGQLASDRSSVYPRPPVQPELAEFDTWPAELSPGEFPRLSDWQPEDRRARLLTQRIDPESGHTAMLGINVVGADDVVTNQRTPITIAEITLAIWGPEFHPSHLKPLDPDGRSLDSGILLWEDVDGNGVFFGQPFDDYLNEELIAPVAFDSVVALRNLRWSPQPELVDLNGDGMPDDLNGDGVVDDRDRAWIARLVPETLWEVPRRDISPVLTLPIVQCGAIRTGTVTTVAAEVAEGATAALEAHLEELTGAGGAKQLPFQQQLDPDANNPGHDLFITVRTSDKIPSHSQFRAMIPSRLPERANVTEQRAGIQFFPQVQTTESAFVKSNPDEGVTDFYGHDMMPVNTAVRLHRLGAANGKIVPGGPGVALLGIELSTNRPEDTLDEGANGFGAPELFTVPGRNWEADSLIGDYLIDHEFEPYEIIGNTADQLELLSGTPRDGHWRVVRNPTFLEEVIVEFYDEPPFTNFNPRQDLLPLNIDQRISGVALYRDNEFHPLNRRGFFEPERDLPVRLDDPPFFTGLAAQDNQVKFVFSSPGTDDIATPQGNLPRAQQPRLRQWVPNTFSGGPDFFVVVRASKDMSLDDNFRIGIVSWGPNTPTEPDPDTWSHVAPNVPPAQREEFANFREFPWASRGLGFITVFKDDPPPYYFMEGVRAGVRPDNSGFNFVRTHSAKKQRSYPLAAVRRQVGPRTLVIDRTSLAVPPERAELPSQILEGQEFPFVIRGQGFGSDPTVLLSGYEVRVVSSNDEAISVALRNVPGPAPQEPLVLRVRNDATGEVDTRDDLFVLTQGTPAPGPSVAGVSPGRGAQSAFPVVITGANFAPRGLVEVRLGQTLAPVNEVSADGTRIEVGYPAGGLTQAGRLDVTVRNLNSGKQDTLVGGFEFIAGTNKFVGASCGAGGGTGGAGWGDALAALGVLATLLAAHARRTRMKQAKHRA